MKKIVLTGGSCSGKTTTINRLREMGYQTVSEAAIEIMEANPQLRSVSQYAFQELVVARQIAREAALAADADEYIFLDRGLIDSLAYCQLHNTPQPPGLHEASLSRHYHAVFALQTLSNFDQRTGTGRTSTEAVSHRTYQLLVEAYHSYGYTVIPVPELPVDERVSLILDSLYTMRKKT